ncbi:hypothetical protein Tco_1168567 [Tanacetum coccineum]
MVAYLKKTEGSEGFHQIVDFLNTSHIRYALTENPTIYVSLIQHFWQTATASTLDNGEMEITATIDGKVKIVTKEYIRRHLNSKKTAWEQFSSNIATAIICLATNRTFNFSKLIFDGMVKNLDSKTKFLMNPRFIQIFLNKHKRLLLPHKRLYIAPTLTQKLFSNMKRASKGYTGVDTPLFQTMLVQGQILQGEGSKIPIESHHTPIVSPSTSQPHHSPTLRDLIRQEIESPQPSSPTQTHVADEAASTSVDVRHRGAATTVFSLDAGHGSGNIDKTPAMPMIHLSQEFTHLEQTKKVYGAAYTKLIKKFKRLEDKLNKSRRKRRLGRKIAQIDKDEGITPVQMGAQTQGRHNHEMEADFEFTTAKDVSTANVSVNTAGAEISTASPKVKTAGVSVDDVAAKGLVYIRRSAAKRKDKGKAIMEESEPTQTKTKIQQEQERLGFEEALRLQEQFDEEERQRIASLAHRLQAQERERYSEADKEKLLVELINERKRQFSQQRAQQRRNMPLTQGQQRSYMCNYIKHMGSHTLQQLRRYSFDKIKVIFKATVKRVNTFTPMKSDDTVPKVVAGSSKRSAEEELGEESSRRQKIGEGSEPAKESKDKESDELSQE